MKSVLPTFGVKIKKQNLQEYAEGTEASVEDTLLKRQDSFYTIQQNGCCISSIGACAVLVCVSRDMNLHHALGWERPRSALLRAALLNVMRQTGSGRIMR